MAAGYSGKPLYQKLGLRPGMRLLVIGAPGDYRELIGPIDGLIWENAVAAGLDAAHIFATESRALGDHLDLLRGHIKPSGMIWVSWPKKAAKLPTDITEDVVRAMALARDLVDVKVCAVDAVWSGLKLVIPLASR